MGRRSIRARFAPLAFFVVTTTVAACGSGGGNADDPKPGVSATTPVPTAPPSTTSTTSPEAGPPGDGCTVGEGVCLAKNRARTCGTGAKWVEETCAAGSGCFQGKCTPARCSDECTLGETQGGKTCAPFDIATGKPAASSDPIAKVHDRARGYLARMKTESLATGGISSARYEDATLSKIFVMDGIGDSALWTGTFLASEALRLHATGAPDARARVRTLVDTMHLWLTVADEPGMLVRWAQVSGTTHPFIVGDLDCANERVHCNIPHAGKKYDFIGHISRDQYQGVVLGLVLAYDALGAADEDLRTQIRGDLVTIVKELMKERSIPVKVTISGIPVTSTVKARFMVVSPREMNNGALDLRLNIAKPDDSEMFGFQEFYPNLAHLVRQLPGLGIVPDFNRASSAMMLASFFAVALHVTDGVPAAAKDHADILAYYTGHKGEGGNVNDWLAVAKQWTDGAGCGNAYYANNIAMMPMYDLARLEKDPGRATLIANEIFGAKMWPAFAKTKNSFFSFIYAATKPGTVDPTITTSAATQLAQFPVAPRIMRPVDLRTSPKYPTREQNCGDQVGHADAVDVGDRVTADFLWQRHPWGLVDGGNPAATQPGVDFLVAYFLGRHHGFVQDDTPGICLSWQ